MLIMERTSKQGRIEQRAMALGYLIRRSPEEEIQLRERLPNDTSRLVKKFPSHVELEQFVIEEEERRGIEPEKTFERRD
jgi:hypothetical protein